MLHIELLTIGSVFKNTIFVDVSMNMVYLKKDGLEFDINSIYLKNSLKMEIKTICNDDEKIVCFCQTTLKMINNIQDMPFNTQFFLLDIECECQVAVCSSRIHEINDSDCDKYNLGGNHIFMWKYSKQVHNSSVLKYMFLPFFLTLVLQLSHIIKGSGDKGNDEIEDETKNDKLNNYLDLHGTWVGVASTFLLTDVALFFTVPQSNKLTNIERSIFMNFFMKVFVAMFAFYDFDNKIGHGDIGHHIVDIVIAIILCIIMCCYCFYIYHKSIIGLDNVFIYYINLGHRNNQIT